jgi:GTP-binding protein Era
MVTATSEMEAVDYTLLVIDAARKLTDDLKEAIVTLMLKAGQCAGRIEAVISEDDWKPPRPTSPEKFAIVLNKVDLVKPKSNLLELAEELGHMAELCISQAKQEKIEGYEDDDHEVEDLFPPIFYISALKEDGTEDILQHLLEKATQSRAWPVSADASTQFTPVEHVEEVLREKIYRCLHREVPHHVKQVNRIFRELEKDGEKVIQIDQDLVVRTKSHRRLVTGSGGHTLDRIRMTAQRDLEKAFGCKVVLRLHVKLTKAQHDRPLEPETLGTVQRAT